ncbi:hypothetical protein HH308_06425 [Gordonia sp. TBRC 11910]|uniref:Uncharacterized protein n=1 Tax=Gordonia asplenii TaxID=2725283 RepID=A0A848KZH3_9ACTN|nr:hypothetical protein [Gordonia asplenii]NMO00848.1 hypothetical protein [Gordonia asplenii]
MTMPDNGFEDWPDWTEPATDAPTPPQPTTVTELRRAHQYVTFSGGDGYSEPREESIGCSCGVTYALHIQHAGCTCYEDGGYDQFDNAPQTHAEHVLAMGIWARLIRSHGSLR